MPAPPPRITLRDVAAAAGCHFSSVSLALRDHPRLPAATREKIRAVARQLGYVADPMLASLSSYRRTRQPVPFRSTLAWLTNHPTRDGWKKAAIFHQYFLGAEERARALGYKLEEFWLRERGLSGARASQILHARNVAGLLLAPQPAAGIALELDWPVFSAVALGYTLAHPSLHLVSTHQYRSMKLAVRRLLDRNYRRIGLVMLQASDDRVDHNWLAGYLVMQQVLPAARRLPHLFLAEWNEAAFAAWVRRHRPDAIVTKCPEVLPALRRLGRRVPADLGVALLTLENFTGDFAGVDENPREVGAAAVDYVAGMIHRNERGVPAMPQRVLIEGTWVDGSTVRPAPASGVMPGNLHR
jgi:LacI family transcriptional regulator